jgi:hypothetical protein
MMWMEVKRLLPSSTTWYSTNDALKGYEYINTATEKSWYFHSSDFTEYLFLRTLTSGGQKWVRALKANVVPEAPSTSFSASVVSTYQSSASQTFTWSLGTSSIPDPLIGNLDTTGNPNPADEVLYREGSKTLSISAVQEG